MDARLEGPGGAVLLAVDKSESESVTAETRLPGIRGQARSLFGDTVLPCHERLTFHLSPYETAAWRLH